jgi:hypothetical protein
MSRLAKAIILVSALSFGATFCHAGGLGGLKPGIRGGYYEDDDKLFVGADVKFSLLMLNANPSVEYVFIDGGRLMTFNADAFMSVLNLPLVSGWVGGGVGWMYFSPDDGVSSTDPLINVIAGVGLGVPLNPYVMVKWILAGENGADKHDGLVVAVGVRF